MVVNHRDRVRPKTRQRVEQAISRLGYVGRGGGAARRQSAKSVLRLAFIYTPQALFNGAESSYCRELIQGLERATAGTLTSLNVLRGCDHVDQDLMFLHQMEAGEFNGLVMTGTTPEDGYLDRIVANGVPLVLINRLPKLGLFSTVTVDYHGGARQAIDHLVSLGHRRIGFLLRGHQENWPSQVMYAGATAAMKHHGLDPVADVQYPINHSPDEMLAVARRFLDAGATAIQTGDVPAVALIEALGRAGVRVPDDVSVMGFDDRGLPSPDGQQISTIGYSKRRMGFMAGRIIQRLCRRRSPLRWLAASVRTHLVVGQTTAAIES